MRHQTQPSPRTCAITCLAMLLDVPVQTLLKLSDKPVHSVEELKDLVRKHFNRHLVQVVLNPTTVEGHIWTTAETYTRFLVYIRDHSGIILLSEGGRAHAVVWDKEAGMIRDPALEEPYTLARLSESINLTSFFYLTDQ